ncbi:ARC6/PARC6 family protein [Kovacikia minuta CCNUW1]|uniref:ARC6/PARC6 family protein n=1 Tax=Kovacikia minuta TaxID=2931930 RepID=UPI001CCE6B99|nr:ARC6/PARC6 family protein [Kovacikia minuta]UBF26345.1 ARC6/PARC6 family protein [Kovacikia minuta CCNUW1]
MRLRLTGLIVGLGLGCGVGVLPVQAQFSNVQVGAFVEALRRAAPQTGRANDGLYSDWQVQAQNIPRWSKSCIGRALTPAQFEADPGTARSVITCVARDVLRDEYRASGNNPAVAVRRAASWWMTGDPNRYNSGDTATYTQRVLNLYQQQGKPNPSGSAPAQPQAQAQTQSQTKTVPYDRYMVAGYEATKRKDHATALLYFKRALDERPEDSYAAQAIRNVESYLKPNQSQAPAPKAQATATTAPITQQQAVELVNQWLQAKTDIFAPPFDQKRVGDFSTGELYASLIRPDGVLDWLKKNQAYYRYGVQKVDSVERFVASRDRATIELNITEDRTLYRNGTVDPRHTDFSAKQTRYSLELVEGRWKIADYKTIDGLLLERSVLDASSNRR